MSAIDTVWLNGLVAQVQDLSLAVVTAEQQELPEIFRRFTQGVASPPDPLHKALLANVLLDVCRHTFESLHASLPFENCSCAAEGWSSMMQCARWYEADPKASLCGWIGAFLPVYERNHPPTVGTRAAEWMRRDPARRWTVASIARRLGVTRKTLGRDFKERFGIGPSEYIHAARVARAILEIDEPCKIEAVAYDVGYRSKKDFYRAFRRWTGLTPARVRALPTESRRMLQASMRARCLWGERHTITHVTQRTPIARAAADGDTPSASSSPDFQGASINRITLVPAQRRAG